MKHPTPLQRKIILATLLAMAVYEIIKRFT